MRDAIFNASHCELGLAWDLDAELIGVRCYEQGSCLNFIMICLRHPNVVSASNRQYSRITMHPRPLPSPRAQVLCNTKAVELFRHEHRIASHDRQYCLYDGLFLRDLAVSAACHKTSPW